MNPFVLVLVLVIISEVVALVAQNVVRNKVLGRYATALDNNNLDEALEALDSKGARFFVPAFNRDYMRFNAYQYAGKTRQASKVLDQLLAGRCSKKQRGELTLRAYYFYLEQGRLKDAKAVLDEIRRQGNERVTDQCNLAWETFAKADSSHIEELEEAFKIATTQVERVNLAMLIAAQHSNKGDNEAAAAWTRKLAASIEGRPEEGNGE